MASLKAETKRAFLQSLYDAVVDETARVDLASGAQVADTPIVTLEEALKAFQRMGFNALKNGKLSLGSSGLGHEVRFAAPPQIEGFRAFGQVEVYGLAQEFREVYADARVTLAAQGNTEPDDATIFSVMMSDDRLQTVTSLQRDFLLLRWGQGY